MEAKAIGRYLRLTPRKARFVLDAVRGKSAKEALAMLKFIPNVAAVYIRQVLESAIANAEHNYAMDREILRISSIYADNGPMQKRIQPRAMGRAFRIVKRMCHITVVVTEDEKLKEVVAKPKEKRTLRRTKATAEVAAPASKATTRRKAAETEAAPKAKRAPKSEPVEKIEAAPAEVEAVEIVPAEVEAIETITPEAEVVETAAVEGEAAPSPTEEQKEE